MKIIFHVSVINFLFIFAECGSALSCWKDNSFFIAGFLWSFLNFSIVLKNSELFKQMSFLWEALSPKTFQPLKNHQKRLHTFPRTEEELPLGWRRHQILILFCWKHGINIHSCFNLSSIWYYLTIFKPVPLTQGTLGALSSFFDCYFT